MGWGDWAREWRKWICFRVVYERWDGYGGWVMGFCIYSSVYSMMSLASDSACRSPSRDCRENILPNPKRRTRSVHHTTSPPPQPSHALCSPTLSSRSSYDMGLVMVLQIFSDSQPAVSFPSLPFSIPFSPFVFSSLDRGLGGHMQRKAVRFEGAWISGASCDSSHYLSHSGDERLSQHRVFFPFFFLFFSR